MYLREKRMFILGIKNIIIYITGVLFAVASLFIFVYNNVRFSGDLDRIMAANARDAVFPIFTASIAALGLALLSRWLMGEARFYSNYFELDLDGYITYNDLSQVTGKSSTFTMLLLSILKPLYMKGFSLDNRNKYHQIILDSKTYECQCRSCAAIIEKKVYFTGICSYCGSSDLNAKVIMGERFYNINTDIKQGFGNPQYYMGKHIRGKKIAYISCAFLCISIALINFMYAMDRITHSTDKEYLRKAFGRYISYEYVHREALTNAAFGFCFMIAFATIGIITLLKVVKLSRAMKGAFLLSKQTKPFIDITFLRKNFHKRKPFSKLKSIQKCGYMRGFTFENHNKKIMLAVAKQIVKDKCPGCAAPITGAVYEDYICSYCGNKIMGVIRKQI